MIGFVKRVISYVSRNLNPKVDSVVSTTKYIHETSVTILSSFGEWTKVQKESYFYNTNVGSYSYFGGFNTVMNANIGKFCSIAQFVTIGPGRHPTNYISTSPVFFSTYNQCGTTFADKPYFKELGSVSIGNDVWIGANVVILDDINIGDGAIIAAGAIVTKDVAPYTIVGGVPAKFIKKRFDDETIDKLLKFQWWNKDSEWLKNNFKLFHDIKELKKLISIN